MSEERDFGAVAWELARRSKLSVGSGGEDALVQATVRLASGKTFIGRGRTSNEASANLAKELDPWIKRAVFPYEEGDTIVLGPEIFVSKDERVICWKGENYYVGGDNEC